MARPAATVAGAIMLGTALLALCGGVAGGLSGCGLKGSLYLPQQKKTKVPETVNNPAADAPPSETPSTSPSTSPSAPAPTPTPTVPEPGSSSPTGPAPRA